MTQTSSSDTVLDRVLRILSAFDARRRQLTVAELSQLADIPLATTYRLVNQLAKENILTRYPNGNIGLGIRLWELAARSSPAVSLRTAAMPFLDDVQSIFRQHTQLSVLDDHELLVVERLSSRNAAVNQATVATRMPIHTVSMGLVQLAFQPQYIIDDYFALYPEATDMSYPGTGSITDTLAKIKRDGFAMLDGMLDDGTTGAADRKSTRLNSSHVAISYAVFCLKKKNNGVRTNSACGTAVARVEYFDDHSSHAANREFDVPATDETTRLVHGRVVEGRGRSGSRF